MSPSYRPIDSDANPMYKRWRRVLTGRGVRKLGATVVSGGKVVMEVLRSKPALCEAWLSTARHPPPPELPEGVTWYQMPQALFREIDVFGTASPLLYMRIPDIDDWDTGTGLPGERCLLLPFQDPDNVGAVIRSAVAFDVDAVVLLEECAHPYHPKSLRSSAGAVVHANLLNGPALADLPPGLPVTPLSPEGPDIESVILEKPSALLPGVEGPGLPHHLRERAVSIPVSDRVESLNAATATAIALYLWRRRLG
jgi:tRNA G18 (ribose-2'-O)-methylase SpoU